MEPIETINWKEAFKASKSVQKLDIRMMDECGMDVTKECYRDGDDAKSERQLRTIIYDKEYVIHKSILNNSTLLQLGKTKYLQLMKEIWERADGTVYPHD